MSVRALPATPSAPAPLPTSDQPQPQELAITILGTYVRPFGDRVWSGGLVVLLGELGFSEGAARVALTRLVRRGLLTRVRDGRLVHYRLTERADRLLAEGDVRIFSLGQPSRDKVGHRSADEIGHRSGDEGVWTLLWHQIPEDRRLELSRLARRLRFLGFGPVQGSVWVSPHDHSVEVIRLLAELGVSDHATVFTAAADTAVGLPALVARAWDLTGLVDRYEAFSAEFAPLCRPRASASATGTRLSPTAVSDRRSPAEVSYRRSPTEVSDREAFVLRTRLVHQFRGFALIDPELPERLAPLSGPRGRAAAIFHELYEGLAAASQRHFDAVVS